MANATVYNERGFSVTLDGSTVWDVTIAANGLKEAKTAGIPISSITLHPAGATKMAVQDDGASGRVMMQFTATAEKTDGVKYFDRTKGDIKLYKPYVAAANHANGDILVIEY